MNGSAQSERSKGLDLVFIGNSITFGAQLNDPKNESPPLKVSEYLQKQLPSTEVRFINQGRSGYTTVDYLPSTKTLDEVISATRTFHLDREKGLIFSIFLGANDSAEDGPNGSPVSPKSYRENLRLIFDRLMSELPESKIIIHQPIWYSPNTYNTSRYLAEGLARLQSYFPEIETLVGSYKESNPSRVFLGDQKGFDFFEENHLTHFVPEKGQQGTFYIHPNKQGAEVLGNLWGAAIHSGVLDSD
ncbi:MAG: hypothetical protein JXR03_04965 [Cyclobacteriaceae bacterium]